MVQLVKVTKNERPALRCYIVPLCIPQPTFLTVFHLSKHLVENNIKIYVCVCFFFFTHCTIGWQCVYWNEQLLDLLSGCVITEALARISHCPWITQVACNIYHSPERMTHSAEQREESDSLKGEIGGQLGEQDEKLITRLCSVLVFVNEAFIYF